jgi:hypothetical protein
MVARYEPQPCPYCAAQLDASEGYEEDVEPRAGDVSICAKCHGMLVFDWIGSPEAELRQRKLTPREFTELPGSTRSDLLRAQAALEALERARKLHEAKH